MSTTCAGDAYAAWGSFYDTEKGVADWRVAASGDNRGGLDVGDPIATAIIIGLLTDRRCPADHPLAKYVEADDLRGWFGDGVDVRADLSEQELGSLLWLLERATATEDNRRWAEAMATDALQPLLACGAARLVEASAVVDEARNMIVLDIRVAGSFGGRSFDRKFDAVWRSR